MHSLDPRVQLIQALSARERAVLPDPLDWLKEIHIADDKTLVGGQDRMRINLSEPYEVTDWTKSLGVTEGELRKAVAEVGDQADAVGEYLGKQ